VRVAVRCWYSLVLCLSYSGKKAQSRVLMQEGLLLMLESCPEEAQSKVLVHSPGLCLGCPGKEAQSRDGT
jgi:hypothetical protein